MSRRIPNSKPITDPDVSATAFLNKSRDWNSAANQLFDLRRDSGPIGNPVTFLYFHAIELALKAFLRSFNLPILGTPRQSHNLTELYEECRKYGLVIGPSDRVEIGNIVTLLEHGNESQGLRYFNPKLKAIASIAWTREVTEQLIRSVEAQLKAGPQQNAADTGRAVRLVFICGKPE